MQALFGGGDADGIEGGGLGSGIQGHDDMLDTALEPEDDVVESGQF